MSVVMRVGAKLDEVAVQRVADRAEGHFAVAGGRAGRKFGQTFEQQVESTLTERAVEKSARKIEAAMTRAGKVSGEALNQAIAAEAQRTGLGADAIGHALQTRLGVHAVSAGAHFREKFTEEFSKVSPGMASAFNGIASVARGAMDTIGGGAVAAAGSVVAIGAAAIEAGKHLYEVGQTFDNVSRSIQIQTGATGNKLHEITEAVDAVAVKTASSLASIGSVASGVSQAFHVTGEPLERLTKQISDLNEMSGDHLNIRDLGKVSRAFGLDADHASEALDQLKVASENTGAPLEELLGTLKNIGPQARSLHLDFGQTAAVIDMFDQAGLDAATTTRGLNKAIAEGTKHHIDLQTVLARSIEEIHGFLATGNEQAAQELGQKLFGSKGSQQFIDAIRNGKLTVDDLNESLKSTSDAGHIENLRDQTLRWADTWKIVKNNIEDALKPFAGPVFDTIQQFLRDVSDPDAARKRNMTIKSPLPDVPGVSVGPGNILPGLGVPGQMPGAPPPGPGGQPGAPKIPFDPNNPFTRAMLGGLGSPALAPGFDLPAAPPGPGGPGLDQQLDDDGKPKKVSLPYPSGYGQPPQAGETEEHWKLRQEQMEKQHTLAEKQAELDQLEHSHVAKQEEIQAARNEVVKAQTESDTAGRALTNFRPKVEVPFGAGYGAAPRPGEPEKLYEAEQGMLEAQQKRAQAQATLQQLETTGGVSDSEKIKARRELAAADREQYLAMMKLREAALNTSKDLGELGAEIDNDFGISKGIPGIVENMTKTIANLAAAPMLGKLAAFTNINEAQTGIEGGSGLMGILGARNLAAGKSPIFGNPLGGAAGAAGYTSIGGGGGMFGALLGLGSPGAGRSQGLSGWLPGSGALPGSNADASAGGNFPGGAPSPGGAAAAGPLGDFGASRGSPTVPQPDENTIRSQVQQMFGIPNTFGTGSWENAAHDADGAWHHNRTHDKSVPGYAFDFHGTGPQMDALAEWIRSNAVGQTLELIYNSPNFAASNDISNTKPWTPSAELSAQHRDHVHWATTALPSQILGTGGAVPAIGATGAGGAAPGGMTLAQAPSGTVPVFVVNMGAGGFGGGGGVGGGVPGGAGPGGAGGAGGAGSASLYQDAGGRWHSSDPWWEGNIQAESHGELNPSGNATHFGLFQFSQRTWDGIARKVAPEWVGKNPGTAPAEVQARMAQENYNQNKGNLGEQWNNDYVHAHPQGTTGQIWSPAGGSWTGPEPAAPAPGAPAAPGGAGAGTDADQVWVKDRSGKVFQTTKGAMKDNPDWRMVSGPAAPAPAAPAPTPSPAPAPAPAPASAPASPPPAHTQSPLDQLPGISTPGGMPPAGGAPPLPGFPGVPAPAAPAPPAPPAPTPPAAAGPAGLGSVAGGVPGAVHPADQNTRTPGGPPGPGGAPTRIGGVEPASNPGGGGAGITPGGSIDTAMGMAASALDVMAPGAGQAAQVGIKLANRAIQYGSQVAGIAASGLMETFLPTGGSELANHNWLTKIGGALAGARPQIPNVAGGAGGAPLPGQGGGGDQKTADSGGGQTNNITINQASQQPVNDITHALNTTYQNQPAMGR